MIPKKNTRKLKSVLTDLQNLSLPESKQWQSSSYVSHRENARNSVEKQFSAAWSSPTNDHENANYDAVMLTIPFLTGERKEKKNASYLISFTLKS